MPTLYLVDGYALIYRAFFAMIARPLTTRRGENTSAAWGVTNFLLRLLERRRPDHLAWVHDVGESFRHRTYPAYKATREKLTAELQQDFDRSVERIEQILDGFRVPVVGVEGFEADDVIGTLATAASARDLQVVIVSGDKDFYQLIAPRIALLNPGRGGPAAVEEHWVDQANAAERLGVPPERVVDYLALVGDTSDNVPGVKGVGEKTALELLKTFGDLDAILAGAARISGKRAREAVQQHAELAGLSRELVTIRRDVPLPLDLEALRVRPADVARLTELFTELEFRTLIPKLEGLQEVGAGTPDTSAPAAQRAPAVADVSGVPATLTAASAEPAIVEDPAQLAAVVAECGRASLVALDTEATSLDPLRADLVGMAVADAARYCATAGEVVLQLHDALQPELEDHQLLRLLETIELPLIAVLVDMEWHGVRIDLDRLSEISRTFAVELAALERTIYQAAGTDFNINSTPQLRHVLFEKHQLPVLKKTKTGPSTDYEVLEQLAAMGHEVPRLLIEYRELSKLKSTYVDALPGFINPATGRIHTSFNQAGAATGRLSSSDPNLQNIPVRTPRGEAIRRAFVAAPGAVLLTADYSQVELRLLAHLSGDPAFVQAFTQGGDIHRQTAAVIFNVAQDKVTSEMRARAKTINFATIYGQGAFALSRQLGITQDEAKQFIEQYFTRFSGVRAWLDRSVAEARAKGYVETLFGRRRYVPELKDRNYNIRAFGERTATNSPLQGSAADLIKIAMVRIAAAFTEGGLASRMILQVHDELVLEVPAGEASIATELVKRHMERAAELRVPLVVTIGVGTNWVDAKG